MVSRMKTGRRPRRTKMGSGYANYNSKGEQTSFTHKSADGTTFTTRRDGTKITTKTYQDGMFSQIVDRPDRKRKRRRKQDDFESLNRVSEWLIKWLLKGLALLMGAGILISFIRGD